MVGMVAWMLGIAVSTVLLVLTAAKKLYWAHMAITALVSIVVAVLAFQEMRAATARPGDTSHRSGTLIRHIALVFCWGAIALAVTYGAGVLTWREWWHYMLAFLVLAGVCLFVSMALLKDGDAGRDDATMLGVARILSLVLLVAMPIVMVGLLVHDGRSFKLGGKMLNFYTEAGQRTNWQDWSANNVFFFGAFAAAALAWNAFDLLRAPSPAK